jgi:serine/threonine protein kinase
MYENYKNGLLGIGKHGNVYTLKDFMLLQKINITSINLYSFNPEQDIVIYDENEISQFINLLNKKKHIVKMFVNNNKELIIKDFEDELINNRKVINMYEENASKYLTVGPILRFKDIEVMGCVANINDNKHDSVHLLFSVKCNNDFKINNLGKYVIDILKSLKILQKKNYQHNDIKIGNTVFCEGNNKYKLIDWGRLKEIDNIDSSILYGLQHNPLLLYVYKDEFPKKFSNLIKLYLEKFKFRPSIWIKELIKDSDIFHKTINNIQKELLMIIKQNPDREQLLNKYKYSSNVYQLGMVMIYAIHKYKLDYNKYKNIINKFTSLTHPVKNAKDAINFVKKKLKL